MQTLQRFVATVLIVSFAALGQTPVKPVGVKDTLSAGASGVKEKSTRKAAEYDSLARIRNQTLQRYMLFPASLDSVFDPDAVGPYRIRNSNAAGISAVLGAMPGIVAVPFALSSGQNRFMLYGFPLLPNSVFPDDNASGEQADAVRGTDLLFATQAGKATFAPPFGVGVSGATAGLVGPHTDVLWENGVFLENLLGVRFVRPLTKGIDVGLYSNFRRLAPFNYSTAGDIRTFYDYSFTDTSLLVNGGRNPLSNENRMTLALESHPSPATGISAAYSYADSRTEQAVELSDSGSAQKFLGWRTVSRYENVLNTELRGLRLSPRVSMDIDGRADLEGHRRYTPLSVRSALVTERMGRNNDLFLGIEPYVAAGADTFSFSARAERKDQRLYDASTADATLGDARLGFRHGNRLGPLYASTSLSAGTGMVKTAGQPIRSDLVFSVLGAVSAGMQRLHLYYVQDHLPFVLPFDSLKAPLVSYNDAYRAYGADLFTGYGKIGISGGFCGVSGVDTAIAGRFWPDNVMPYSQPSYSLMVTPSVGRIWGFALSSRMMLSDRKPFVKSLTCLSYQAEPIAGREHITADLNFDYWSGRDPVSYAGITTWNREIFNLSLVTAVHIQGFCLFYKIDNILNRKYSYEPGYFMPGITFRWGFQWLIPG
jgi:hypothetical protein